MLTSYLEVYMVFVSLQFWNIVGMLICLSIVYSITQCLCRGVFRVMMLMLLSLCRCCCWCAVTVARLIISFMVHRIKFHLVFVGFEVLLIITLLLSWLFSPITLRSSSIGGTFWRVVVNPTTVIIVTTVVVPFVRRVHLLTRLLLKSFSMTKFQVWSMAETFLNGIWSLLSNFLVSDVKRLGGIFVCQPTSSKPNIFARKLWKTVVCGLATLMFT